jgi:hypothetical protein
MFHGKNHPAIGVIPKSPQDTRGTKSWSKNGWFGSGNLHKRHENLRMFVQFPTSLVSASFVDLKKNIFFSQSFLLALDLKHFLIFENRLTWCIHPPVLKRGNGKWPI